MLHTFFLIVTSHCGAEWSVWMHMEKGLQKEQEAYVSPFVEIIQLNSEAVILTGSSEDIGGGGV